MFRSLPSRGAWIEMIWTHWGGLMLIVAPLAGSVDRNSATLLQGLAGDTSLPSRGAWIEMDSGEAGFSPALSLPSRGAWIEITMS